MSTVLILDFTFIHVCHFIYGTLRRKSMEIV